MNYLKILEPYLASYDGITKQKKYRIRIFFIIKQTM